MLISALLVALTSVPTMIVVVAGSATLDSRSSSRTPVIAEPRPGPVVVDSSPRTGLHPSGVPDRSSLAAVPTAPQPPGRPRTSARASGGSGGGLSVGTGTRPPKQTPVEGLPPSVPPPPTVVPGDSSGGSSGGSAGGRPPTSGVPIQDRAWPGWDSGLKGKRESTRGTRRVSLWWPSRSGSIDQPDPC
ncbi:hypothetical protein Drose_00480 [Dactylosporangium roseum]|uniref:Secreted protein n=1 Tax=Dactylosporangium roseum TaxID=47989 RepID=A0ABY5Z5B9_9ACTN|nr:hypothetical protein [Dactylosporangium roseum]UWZ36859.1 hypothetical protein Drose_00480 [Dactylosporangium roseum]